MMENYYYSEKMNEFRQNDLNKISREAWKWNDPQEKHRFPAKVTSSFLTLTKMLHSFLTTKKAKNGMTENMQQVISRNIPVIRQHKTTYI